MLKVSLILAAALVVFGPASLRGSANSTRVMLAGQPYVIDKWDADDGFPQSSVTAITQTPDGYLWLGTLNGLVRFDGIRFAVFDENNTPGLKSSRITSLFADRRGQLWVGTEHAGVHLWKEGQAIDLGIGRGRREGAAVCEDTNGAVWVCTADGQLWRYDNATANGSLMASNLTSLMYQGLIHLIQESPGSLLLGTDSVEYRISMNREEGTESVMVRRRFVEKLEKLEYLLASRNGGYWRIFTLAGETQTFGYIIKWGDIGAERDLAFSPFPWGSTRISTACEDKSGNLMVGTLGAGLFWFDAEGQVVQVSTKEGLSYNYVFSSYVDREGNLWVGTDGGGLNRIKRQQAFEMVEETTGLVVQSVCPQGTNELWMGFNILEGTDNGVGRWKDGVFKKYGRAQGLHYPSVRSVFLDSQQRLWAGTVAGLYQLQGEKFRPMPYAEVVGEIAVIYQDKSGLLWVGTQRGLAYWDEQRWRSYSTRDGLSANIVRAIAEDKEGDLWIGTYGGGLNRLQNGAFTVFRKGEQGLPSDNISSLHVDAEGVLWVGTDGGGLARYEGEKWTRYSTSQGLLSNSIGYLLEDDLGFLWIGSNAGLMRVHKGMLNDFAHGKTTFIQCRAYGKPDGLPTRECTSGSQPGACRTPDGKLWFSTIKGLGSVDPRQISTNPYAPNVVIESVLLDGQVAQQVVNGGIRTVKVPARKERLEIQYTSLNLGEPEHARFKYRLEGHEAGWEEAGNRRVALYSKLPPSRYTFVVTACNEDGVWNPTGSALAIIVEPPFWRTWWFLSVSSIALLGSIVGVVHYISTQRLQRQLQQLQQQEVLQGERSRIARDLHDQLGASLTQVALLGELAESDKEHPAEVEAHARQISQTARETTRVLDEIVWTVNPSNDTLEGLVNYVCKYAQEYLAVAGLKYRLEVPSQLPAILIAPEVRHNVFLASKEAVTNVVRHAKASSVWLGLKLEPNRFTLEIADDGRGVVGLDPKAAQTRNGLKNMRQRLEEVGGEFWIGPRPEGGALVRLSAPLKSKPE